LGIMPGAGGTQRTPRLTGAEAALRLITTGKHVGAAEAHAMGLIDRIADGEPRAIGIAHARDLLAKGEPPRRASELPSPEPLDWDAAHAEALAKGRGQIAPATAVRAVQAASEMPYPEGLRRERELFQDLMDSPQREGLIHAFFAERAVTKLPELRGVEPRPLNHVGVIGGGTMGSGIATACLLAGLPVTLIETTEEALQRGFRTVEGNLDGAVQRGKMTPEAREEVELHAGTEMEALRDADLIVEAVFEEMDVKRDVFRRLDAVAKPGAVLATNTSYLDVDEIAAVTERPEDVLGLHFFSPAHVMKLLEIVQGPRTAPEVLATGFALAKRLGKTPVRAGVCDGFIGNRILNRWRMAVDHMVLDGASPYEVDRALEAFGFAMGPYKVADLAGLDIGWANRKRLAATRDPQERDPVFSDRLCEQGHFGRKTGRGFYDYASGRPEEIEDTLRIVSESRDGPGRDFSPEEIQRRTMAAMVDEAARVVEEGIAARPLDVDVTLVHGYGFPRWRGGPMHWADREGLGGLAAEIRRYAEEDPRFWRLAPLLERLASEGGRFAELNG
jgi:3-hydroxyacyl-CoA dehydrogenase